MTLVLFASYDDVKQIRYEIAYKTLISAVLLGLTFSLIVFWIVKKLVKPLKELSEAAVKLSNGDYDLEIKHSDTYEIQQLSLAFENMLINLREHKKIQQAITYRDPLTGLRNTTSYWDWIIDFNKKINEEEISFGVVVFDLNRLKETNDTYGHNSGNKLIVTAAKIISETFKRSPVFRIGGDEFVVILQNRDLADRELLFEKFEKNCWVKLPYVTADTVPTWSLMYEMVELDTTMSWNLEWEQLYGSLPEGNYRIGKKITGKLDDGVYETFDIRGGYECKETTDVVDKSGYVRTYQQYNYKERAKALRAKRAQEKANAYNCDAENAELEKAVTEMKARFTAEKIFLIQYGALTIRVTQELLTYM